VNGILFDGFNGLLYGTVAITVDVEIPEYHTLTIPTGTKLTIPKDRTLTVNGTVVNNGTIVNYGTIIGTIENNQPVDCDSEICILTFNVFDAKTEGPILDAVITFNGEELEGYEVEVEVGSYEYTVYHPDYELYSDTQYVNESMTIDVPLTAKEEGIVLLTFNVFDAKTEEPILDAVITFNGEELEGYEVEVEVGSYEYTVYHPDYELYSDTQYVNESMTIDVPLTGKEGIVGIAIDNVVLYPNPFTNEISVSNPSFVKSVVITNATGQIVKTVAFDGKTISTKELASGIYFVIIENHNGEKTVNKMIKK
jgi:hypothetical protein